MGTGQDKLLKPYATESQVDNKKLTCIFTFIHYSTGNEFFSHEKLHNQRNEICECNVFKLVSTCNARMSCECHHFLLNRLYRSGRRDGRWRCEWKKRRERRGAVSSLKRNKDDTMEFGVCDVVTHR